jgi:serine phosphatase RsbU (regulator of sigma subunit)
VLTRPKHDVASDVGTETPGIGREAVAVAQRGSHWSAVLVLIVGLVLTVVLVVGAADLHDSNENRLLRQRAREAGTVVTAAVPTVQTPLSSAAVLAEATSGNALDFQQFWSPIVAAGRPFSSVSLWPVGSAQPRPFVVVGDQPELAAQPASAITQFFTSAIGKPTFAVENLLSAPDRRLGYALTAPTPSARYIVYGENALPKNRTARIASNSAFSDLNYALYLGNQVDSNQLLASSTGGTVLRGRQASAVVPYGNTQLLLVLSPHAELGGTLTARLPWILGIFGVLLTLVAALLVEVITRRRNQAAQLAADNAQLYADQRSVAQTLQQSLLADLPEVPGLEVGSRYIAGVEGIDVGGDWYDLVVLDHDHCFLAVGDVSGRGLEAATLMASLRYAIRAYALQGDAPGDVLAKLAKLLQIGRDGHFATVLCGVVDIPTRAVTLASAGHLQPLVVAERDATFINVAPGSPVGASTSPTYNEATTTLPEGATLIMYTDGLVERRGEVLDIGLARLRTAASGAPSPLQVLLTEIVNQSMPNGSTDDTALLGVRWQ